ncbi:PD-(D/E)XK nuclease family protein [Pelotomaculum propionicicum]|uniref:PD-(D/E)XK nuclease family protein n=1 Tax=Pelotomaculum propionicicum TaxID=258475 RepID=UPI003B8180AD
MDMQVFSFSRLTKFEDCPACFYSKYILRIDEPPTEPLVLGKGAHSVIEGALKLKTDSREVFSHLCDVVIGNAPLSLDKDELLGMTHQPNVLKYIGKECRIEEHFQIPIDPDDPFSPEIQGYIDLYLDEEEDLVELNDWKSNRKSYVPTSTHQLGLYAGYLAGKTGKRVKGQLTFLRTKEVFDHLYEPDNGIVAAQKWAKGVACEIQSRISSLESKEGTAEEIFPATPGDVCRYCGWAEHCTGKTIEIPDALKDIEEAAAVGAEIFRLESALTSLKEKLKAYVKRYGPVVVGKREFALSPSQYWSFNGDGLEKAFNKMKSEGVDPFSVMSLTAKGIKKLNWSEADIKALGGNLRTTVNFKDIAAG